MRLNCSSSLKLTAILLSIWVSACPAPTKTEVRVEGVPKPFQPTGDAVVLFPTHHEAAGGEEGDFVRCLKEKLEKEFSGRVRIIDTTVFQNHLFPWFEPHCAPETIEELNELLSQRLVRERITSLGVRYLVNIACSSESDGFPGIICGAGYGGAGCFGVGWENKKDRVYAIIFDVVEGVQSVTLSATASGKSVGFAFVLPILFLARTEADACKALASELGRLLTGATEAK